VFILDALAKYEPSAKDAEDIIERVTPRLKHANSAVAMSAVKVSRRLHKHNLAFFLLRHVSALTHRSLCSFLAYLCRSSCAT
jgi:vesicle coat complex subunit